METKLLRSLIHERFPFELRVELELLSRKRSMVDKKQEELIKLLKRYQMNDIVQLGPGTNRYAFKLDGFVIKFATDNDGKIDNFKEFKMAKLLYPHVIKVYEVSRNGTMLVTEYIQPFDSFTEMYRHADEIRMILSKMSSMYLIGDVGISERNYSNWGTRIGSSVPVCLDFAYVYEVSSSLFICKYCKTNSMLVPDKDFVKLYCPNTACGRIHTFEQIRGLIGNDIHRHEIGDLGEEGYTLERSFVETELVSEKSTYLKKLSKKQQEQKAVELAPVHFQMAHPPSYYLNKRLNGR